MCTFDELIHEADTIDVSGWDFGWLDGRATLRSPCRRAPGRHRPAILTSPSGRFILAAISAPCREPRGGR
jgi:hypothetical protein